MVNAYIPKHEYMNYVIYSYIPVLFQTCCSITCSHSQSLYSMSLYLILGLLVTPRAALPCAGARSPLPKILVPATVAALGGGCFPPCLDGLSVGEAC